MKQVVLEYRTGDVSVVEAPAPLVLPGTVLVDTTVSLISVGTEKHMLEMGRKSLAQKALARPDLARRVLQKVRTEGLGEAYRQVVSRLDAPIPMGYSAAGVVAEVGDGVDGISVGDRVACAGSGLASHAELLRVPRPMLAKIPDGVSDDAGAFVALGGIAIHGIRMGRPEFGDRAAVIGLGLLGQLAVQILRGAGCRVCAVDLDPDKVQMARGHGAIAGAVSGRDDVSAVLREFTEGRGADLVLVTASGRGNAAIELAAECAGEKGRVVVPGLVGLQLPRAAFYEKELELIVSRAWGPGVSDPDYESGRTAYPYAHVRWTAQRNAEEFLRLLADGRVSADRLVTHRFPIAEAPEAYRMLMREGVRAIGVLLEYPAVARPLQRRIALPAAAAPDCGLPQPTGRTKDAPRGAAAPVRVGLIGAGLFAQGTLLPALRRVPGVELRGVATSSGLTAQHVAARYGMRYCATDPEVILQDDAIDLVLILTRHGSHAELVCRALRAGKKVFVEKPLCTTPAQLRQIVGTYLGRDGGSDIRRQTTAPEDTGQAGDARTADRPFLAVGFNRRFAPATVFAVRHLAGVPPPFCIGIRVNVGPLPRESWVHDPESGGGSIVGEVCHFVDLLQSLTGSVPTSVTARPITPPHGGSLPEDNLSLTFAMGDGSVGTILYTTLGDKAYPRERVELFGGGGALTIEDFARADWTRAGRRQRFGSLFRGVDRGHRTEMETLIGAVRDGRSFPVPFESYLATSHAVFAAVESLKTAVPVAIPPALDRTVAPA